MCITQFHFMHEYRTVLVDNEIFQYVYSIIVSVGFNTIFEHFRTWTQYLIEIFTLILMQYELQYGGSVQ